MSHKLLPARGVPVYPNSFAFPEGAQGDLAVSLADNALYEFDGSTWNAIASAASITSVSDTNSIDLTNTSGTLSADLVVQNTNSIELAVDSSGLKADLAYVDTNSIDLSVGASGLSADLIIQDSPSVDLTVDASGLKADVQVSATGTAGAGNFAAVTSIKDDGIFVEVQESDVLSTTLTGYAAATGTVADSDTILSAFNKLGYHALITEPAQVVTVAASGAMFTSIQDAIDSITDAAANKVYAVEIAPGIYTENVTLKAYVQLVGISNGSAAPLIVGTITSSNTGAEWSAINRINHIHTITGDSQCALTQSGGLQCNDYFCIAQTSGDYDFCAVNSTHGDALTVFFNSYVQALSTYDGATKEIKVIDAAGTGTGPFRIGNSTLVATAASVSGDVTIINSSVDGDIVISGNTLQAINTKASYSGVIKGFCFDNATSYNRFFTNNTIDLTGTSGGTGVATCLDTSGNSGTVTTHSNVIRINGFDNRYISSVGDTDVQKDWLMSTDGLYTKSGAGLAIVTPYDLEDSGFVQWTGSGNYYSFNPATREFTVLRAGIGMIRSAPVAWAANQTVTLTQDFTSYFIYVDGDGLLQFTSDPGFTDKILLFSVYSDGSQYIVTKQTHIAAFPAEVSSFIHNAYGSILDNEASGVLTLLDGASRSVQMVGSTTYRDHGLNTTVADSGGAAITLYMAYTGASGTTFWGPVTGIPGLVQSGTSLASGTNGKYVNYRVGVGPSSNLSDDTAEQVAQYVIIPGSVEHANATAAANAITANSVTAFPTDIAKGCEFINLGFVTIQIDGAGGGTLTTVTPRKQTFGVNFASGSTSAASTITTDTSLFDKNLSAADTTVQLALNTLDEFNALPNNATNASASPDLHNKTAFASAATGTSATFTFDSRGAIEFLVDVNTDGGMVIACGYKSDVINALSDPSGLFLPTDSGTGLYISKSANSAAVSIKNNMGAAKTIGVLAVRSSLTATAWS